MPLSLSCLDGEYAEAWGQLAYLSYAYKAEEQPRLALVKVH